MTILNSREMPEVSPDEELDDLYGQPKREYINRLQEREQQQARIVERHGRLWIGFWLALGLCGVLAFTAFFHQVATSWLSLPLVMLTFIVRALAQNTREYLRVCQLVTFYELGVLRLTHRWQGAGCNGDEFLPQEHLYARDLDLFGRGSLFEFLCTARTGVGRATLARWLLTPAASAEILERQQAIEELRDRLALREEWASAGKAAVAQVDAAAVLDWAGKDDVDFSRTAQLLVIALPICLLLACLLAVAGVLGSYWTWGIALTLGLEGLLAALLLKKTRAATTSLIMPSFELSLLSPLLSLLEQQELHSSLLVSLQSKISGARVNPSRHIRQLSVLVRLLDLRQSEYFAFVCALLLWGTNLSILIERWRRSHRRDLTRWLESIGHFDALLCLARYYYENPDCTFPILELQSPLFHAEGLGHPLLDRRTCVRCDVRLDAQATGLVMVSGSNMSGKSTLLRSVGVNAVLALAGAPVRATRLHISQLRIGCSIALQDSFSLGKSRFAVEVERLRKILSLSSEGNLLFLLDEILGGTNSADRLVGANEVIERLIRCDAIGLVTTHDLILTQVTDLLDKRAIRVHFREYYLNGEMRFDYQMRPGNLAHTNGRNVMAALGIMPLPIEGDASDHRPR